MAVEIIEDLVEGSGFQRTADGLFYNRAFKVLGIPRAPTSSFHYRAYEELVRQVPGTGFGQYHDSIQGLIAERIIGGPVANSREQSKIIIQYRDLMTQRIRVNGTLSQEYTRFDRDGNLLGVYFKRGESNTYDAQSASAGEVHYAQVPTLVPGSIYEVERYEDIGLTGRGTPFDVQLKYKAAMNASDFQGQPKHTWRCLDVTGEQFGQTAISVLGASVRLNQIWQFVYRFEFTGFNTNGITNTYNPVLVWLDRHTGQPPGGLNPKAGGYPQATLGNGWRQATVLREADFNQLQLPRIRWAA